MAWASLSSSHWGLGWLWFLLKLTPAVFVARMRKPVAIQVGCWAITTALVIGVQTVHLHRVQAEGERAAQAVLRYRQQHGAWPASLPEAGVTPKRRIDLRVYYHFAPESLSNPHLFYRDPLFVFDTYLYDFDRREWRYLPD